MRYVLLLCLASGLLAGGCQRHSGEWPTPAAVSASVPGLPAVDKENDVPPAPEESGPIDIAWDELEVGIPADSVFEAWMMKTSIKALDGKLVRIIGYMHGGVPVRKGIREFVLLRNIDCPFGQQGEAHHAMMVELQGDLRAEYTSQPFAIEGIFRIQPMTGPDGNTWALYRLEGTAIGAAVDETPSPHDAGSKDEVQ